MPSFQSISELSLSELIGEEIVEIVITALPERRPMMIVGQSFQRGDMGEDFNGAAITVLLERTGWTVEGANRDGSLRSNPTSVKILREIWPLIRGEAGILVNVYAGYQAKTPEDTLIWQGPFPFVVGQSVSVQPLVEGAFLGIKFTSDGQPPWSLIGLDVDLEAAGEVY